MSNEHNPTVGNTQVRLRIYPDPMGNLKSVPQCPISEFQNLLGNAQQHKILAENFHVCQPEIELFCLYDPCPLNVNCRQALVYL